MAVPEIVGPICLKAVGEEYTEPAQIRAVLWEGATTAGDTCQLRDRATNRLLFRGRATGAQTWQGLVLSMSCPKGFELTQISAGEVVVYLAEPAGV